MRTKLNRYVMLCSNALTRISQYLTLYQTTNLNSSKLKEFADDNFKFHENSGKFSKNGRNIVGKREIARYK